MDTNYYVTTALQALQAAHAANHDLSVASHLSQAMDALQQIGKKGFISHQTSYDPYEIDELNSAV